MLHPTAGQGGNLGERMAPMDKLALWALALALVTSACGGERCPGEACAGCETPDCDLPCPTGEVRICGNFGYFDDPQLDCVYCSPP